MNCNHHRSLSQLQSVSTITPSSNSFGEQIIDQHQSDTQCALAKLKEEMQFLFGKGDGWRVFMEARRKGITRLEQLQQRGLVVQKVNGEITLASDNNQIYQASQEQLHDTYQAELNNNDNDGNNNSLVEISSQESLFNQQINQYRQIQLHQDFLDHARQTQQAASERIKKKQKETKAQQKQSQTLFQQDRLDTKRIRLLDQQVEDWREETEKIQANCKKLSKDSQTNTREKYSSDERCDIINTKKAKWNINNESENNNNNSSRCNSNTGVSNEKQIENDINLEQNRRNVHDSNAPQNMQIMSKSKSNCNQITMKNAISRIITKNMLNDENYKNNMQIDEQFSSSNECKKTTDAKEEITTNKAMSFSAGSCKNTNASVFYYEQHSERKLSIWQRKINSNNHEATSQSLRQSSERKLHINREFQKLIIHQVKNSNCIQGFNGQVGEIDGLSNQEKPQQNHQKEAKDNMSSNVLQGREEIDGKEGQKEVCNSTKRKDEGFKNEQTTAVVVDQYSGDANDVEILKSKYLGSQKDTMHPERCRILNNSMNDCTNNGSLNSIDTADTKKEMKEGTQINRWRSGENKEIRQRGRNYQQIFQPRQFYPRAVKQQPRNNNYEPAAIITTVPAAVVNKEELQVQPVSLSSPIKNRLRSHRGCSYSPIQKLTRSRIDLPPKCKASTTNNNNICHNKKRVMPQWLPKSPSHR